MKKGGGGPGRAWIYRRGAGSAEGRKVSTKGARRTKMRRVGVDIIMSRKGEC